MSEISSAFHPVRQVSAHELVLDQLRRSIELGHINPGETLPAERDLALFFDVSRAVVRAAIAVLEREEMIVVRRGRGGGFCVQPPPFEANKAEQLIRKSQDEIRDVIDFGLIVEVGSAKLAAERHREGDLTHLRNLLNEHATKMKTIQSDGRTLQNVSMLQGIDNAFHLGVASASQNETLINAVTDTRRRLWLPIGAAFWDLEDSISDHHESIIEAIEAADTNLAKSRMEAHINDTRTKLKAWLS